MVCFTVKGFNVESIPCPQFEHIRGIENLLKNSGDIKSAKPEEEQACFNIDPSLAETALFFNQKGMQAYYLYSKCFWELANRTLNNEYCNM